MQLRQAGHRCDRRRDDGRVLAAVQREILHELHACAGVRLEREHASTTAQLDCGAHRVHPDMRADVDEVAAASQVPRH